MTPGEQEPDKEDQDKELVSLQTPVRWVQALSRSYSWRLLTMVIVTNHLLKGFVAGGGDEGLVGKPVEFIARDLGMTASRLQFLKAAAISPWALKPLLAIISDSLPICGYKKMPYVIIMTIGAFIATMVLGCEGTTSMAGIVTCLFFIFLQVSAVDLMVEAKQSEEVKQKAALGPQFFQFTWLGINFGQVASVCILGPLIYHHGPWVPYLVAAPFILLVLWPALGNFLGERPMPAEARGCDFRVFRVHPVLCCLTLMIGGIVVVLVAGSFLWSEFHVFVLALVSAALVLVSFGLFLRPEIAGPVVFYFLLGLFKMNVEGAMFYFYTDTAEEYPSGPHFTAYFYTTGLGAAVFCGYIIGNASSAELFQGWSYVGILRTTILLQVLTQLLFVPMMLRWTRMAGIPDGAWSFMLTLLDSIVFSWRWIPKQVMGAHLTTQGMEATMLGLTAGTFNMSSILSSYCGAFLLHWFGVRPSGDPAETAMFQNLWKVQTIVACLPALLLLPLPWLMPSKGQTEALITEQRASATHGSYFERLTSAASARNSRDEV